MIIKFLLLNAFIFRKVVADSPTSLTPHKPLIGKKFAIKMANGKQRISNQQGHQQARRV